jgi:hypothetical protein
MKKILTCIALLSVSLFSCKKDHKPAVKTDDKLYDVKFSMASFSQTIVDGKTTYSIPATGADIQYLLYQLYDSANQLKKTIVVPSTATEFGTFRDSLKTGSYTAVFAGFSDQYDISGSVYQNTQDSDVSGSAFFYKKVSFSVGSSNITQSVALDRMTAEIQVVIKDAIPAGIKRIRVTASFETYTFDLLNGVNLPQPAYRNLFGYVDNNVSASAIGTSGYVVPPAKFIHNTITPMTVVIQCYNSTTECCGNPTYLKTVSNVLCKANTRTILTGNVFSGDTTSTHGFSVAFKSSFDTDTIKTHF